MRETSLGLLTGYLGSIMDAIVSSIGRCPLALRLAFKKLQQRVEERFPGVEHQVGWVLQGRCGCWCGLGNCVRRSHVVSGQR